MSNKEQLVVNSVNLINITETLRSHHTNRFELTQGKNPTVVLRRGQVSQWVIIFSDREYDPNKDIVELIFTFGNDPKVENGTKAVVKVTDKDDANTKFWHAKVMSNNDNSLAIEMRTPANIPVGEWKFCIETKPANAIKGTSTIIFEYPLPIYLLFNPWVKRDQVYMNEESLLNEYVLNNVGKIWQQDENRGAKWDFDQFDAIVLPVTTVLLEKASIEPAVRGNAVHVTRAITRILNSNDDDGVLEGRWSGDYEGEVHPAHWTSSIPILQQYLDTGSPVKYGQCWVFAGLVNTVCRALGIPCRVVTNYSSGRDTDGNLVIDQYFSADGDDEEGPSKDFAWNFHVWNDVWMARPDLPKGYGGWQAIDATPQEISEDFKQCGPASLEAIKRGEVRLNYDVGFLIASVNGDVVHWIKDDSTKSGFTFREFIKDEIGRSIVTKKPGIFDEFANSDKEVITDIYKNKEGTIEELTSILNGAGAIKRARKIYRIPNKSKYDVDFHLTILNDVKLGESFTIAIKIHNKSSEKRKIKAVLSASSAYAIGIKAHVIKKDATELDVTAGSNETFKLEVNPEDYLSKLVDRFNIKIYASATVVDTNQIWAREKDFLIPKPNLHIKVKENPVVNKQCIVECSFQNPLKKHLTNCKIQCKVSGSSKNANFSHSKISPEEEIHLSGSFTPERAGKRLLVGTFSSNELVDITGSIDVKVLEEQEDTK